MGKKILHFRENEANITALQQTAAARGSLRQNAARIRIQNPNPESESESGIRIRKPNPEAGLFPRADELHLALLRFAVGGYSAHSRNGV